MRARIITALILFIVPLRLFAGVETFTQSIQGSAIVAQATYTTSDDKYTTMSTNSAWSTLFTNYRVTNKVSLSINPAVLQINALSGGVTVEIKTWKWNTSTNAFVTATTQQTLAVNYLMTGTDVIDEIASYAFTDAHQVEVKVISVNGGASFDVNDVILKTEIEVERYYAFSGSAPASPSVSIYNEYYQFDWSLVTGAEFYELEWVHINDYKATSGALAFTASELTADFYRNATRVILRTNSYRIPKLFDRGYVVFRIRAVGLTGTDFTSRKEGSWNISETIQLSSLTANVHYAYVSGAADMNMNWGHQVMYAEDGKRFESISFVDGLGRTRQTLGHNTETGQVVVSNVYYDGYGRPVLSDLPTPDDNENMTHRLNFNHAQGASFYGNDHFDQVYIANSPGCSFQTAPFATDAGAGKYYSPQNPDQDGENIRIPDAQQYPFARVEYMDDHSGRIRRVGSVGPEFQIGSGHETKFFYATPSQEELDRLFGSEVGYNTHYQKRITVDANDQAYVEYFDMAGRVIASGLIGKAPANLSALDNNTMFNMTQTITDSLNGEVTPTSMILTQPLTIVESQNHTFSYDLNPAQFTDNTCAPGICFDCVYNLKIEITTEECGDVVLSRTMKINGATYDAICNGTYPYGYDTTIFLAKNNYILTKTLTVDQEAINQYWCTYLENNTCVPTFTELFNGLYTGADFDACDNVLEYDEDEEQTCDVMREMMLHDVSPGGQYAQYTVIGSTYLSNDPISVLYTAGTPQLSGNWRAPSTMYKDALGNEAWVEVTPLGSGVYSPAVTATPVGPLANGNYKIHPDKLANLSDFVQRFEDSWAESLLPFHPEYCYLQYCTNNNASHNYDLAIADVNSYTTACNGGNFAPLGAVAPNQAPSGTFNCATTGAIDPFFTSNPTYQSAMQSRMSNYITIGGANFSMLDYSIILNNCPDVTTAAAASACVRDFKPTCSMDMIWITFRDLYLDAKAAIYADAEQDYIAAQGCSTVVDLIGDATIANNPFANAVPRWGFYEEATSATYTSDPAPDVEAQSETLCATVCEQYANDWINALANCPAVASYIQTQANRTILLNDFKALCAYGCDNEHPSGATTLPNTISPSPFTLPGGGTLTGGAGINEILAIRVPNFGENDLCTELLISEPKPYQEILLEGAFLDTCGCDLLLTTRQQFNAGNLPAGITTIEGLLAYNTGLEMDDIDALTCKCSDLATNWNTSYNWGAEKQTTIHSWYEPVPQELTCDDCVDCAAVTNGKNALITRFDSTIISSENYPVLLTNFLNEQFGFDLTYDHYSEFMLHCSADETHPVCEPTAELHSFAEVLNLIANRGQLLTASQNPLDLVAQNVVYKKSDLRDYLSATAYYSQQSGNELQLSFVKNGTVLPCTTSLQLPEAPAYTFSDIVGFGHAFPIGGNCSTLTSTFGLEVLYYSCGVLMKDTLTGTTDCFPVQQCYCGGPLTLCNETINEQLTDDTPCYEPLLSQIYQEAQEQYELAVAAAREEFIAEYNSACASAFASEHFEYTGPFSQYQYTLFYYDQAGNLVKTIAPKGLVTLATTDAVETSRNNTTGITNQATAVLPAHTYKTEYVYNSYDQLVSTTNPDQDGSTKYWYDRFGRIALSQNPVQAGINTYSYVLYDIQGRPVEAGQVVKTVIPDETAVLKATDPGAEIKAWVYGGSRSEVTYTVYDKPMLGTIAAKFAAGIQQNLRLRVASVVYFEAVSAAIMPTTGYVSATHYSYDVHGNVIETLQDVPQLVPVQQDIKSTQYSFELLSGNVKKVEYQKNKPDRMTHEYKYDKLNRLTEVWTSTDGEVHKSREARYSYFDYGPLSRVEIGHHKVQGNDYAYTINGWLKAMNGTTLDRQRDGGKDGGSGYLAANSNVNQLVAPDVIGYTLGYYKGDYKSIGITGFEAAIGSGNALSNAIKSLYNGNIAYTTMAIDGYETKAGVYVYDQLQRLKAMRIFHASSLQATNNWNTSIETQEYSSSYSYDVNGNLTSLIRKGSASIALDMDNFAYKYVMNSNRLTYVDDGSSQTSAYTNDINSGQSGTDQIPMSNLSAHLTDNYQYDKLGQLVKDVQEGNQEYTWRTGDKKLKLQKSSTKQLEFVYNPFGQRVLKIEKAISGGAVVAQNITPWVYTYYAYDANGQVMATYNVTMMTGTNAAKLDEQMIYGAGRLGVVQSSNAVDVTNQTTITNANAIWINKLGKKVYELTNHLGNVNALITDRKVVNPGYAELANETFTSSYPSWNTSVGCGTISYNYSGGALTVSSGSCVMMINRTHAVTAGTTYTFGVDIVDRSAISGFTIDIQSAPSVSGPYTNVTPQFTNLQNGGRFTFTFTAPAGATYMRYMFRKVSTEANAGFTIDNLYLGTATAQYSAVVLQKMDYYPFGMEMPGGIEVGSIPASITGSGTLTEQPVTYTNYRNTFTNADGNLQLASTSAASSTDNAANGVQTVMPGEYIEFTASPSPVGSNRNFVGLSYVDGGFLQTSINYSWYLYPDGGNHIFESGVAQYSASTFYVPGVTKFRISRTGGNIVYSKNGVVVRTVAETNPNLPMVIDITIWNTNTANPAIVYQLKVAKLEYVVATYAIGDYLPYTHGDYRFGYNGMEKDPEMKGDGNSYTTEFRQYDPRLGRWLSLDPMMASFPWQSPYCAFDNNPVYYTDPYGLSTTNPDGGEWNTTRAPEPETEVGGEGRMYEPPKEYGYYTKIYNYLHGDRYKNYANEYAASVGVHAQAVLGGDIYVVATSKGEGAKAFIKDRLDEDYNIEIKSVVIESKDEFLYKKIIELLDTEPLAVNLFEHKVSEEIYGEDGESIIVTTTYEERLVVQFGRSPIRFRSGSKNGVYGRMRAKRTGKPLPYIGKSFNINTRYAAYDRLASGLRPIVSNINDPYLLRAIEQRMQDYLKVEKNVEIDNMRRAMNLDDYIKYKEQVDEALKGFDWQKALDEMFGL